MQSDKVPKTYHHVLSYLNPSSQIRPSCSDVLVPYIQQGRLKPINQWSISDIHL
ncbi:conserved hypothetical protein [Ricinus communis]|uniref:Uncharacterized protein n=1 Tax=Ricinus communis TaxID=3988 RepID=B9SGF6_RICCO|nr:conserved hypothetical protein [Ricinus communis]